MNLGWALAAITLACWHAWRGLAARLDGMGAALPLLLVLSALLLPLATRARPWRAVALMPLSGLLASYALAVCFAPPVFSLALAALAVCFCLHAAAQDETPRLSLVGLVLLALPVLPTLEFYSAYPVRLAAIEATASLLRMNGVAVDVEGLALRHGEQLLQFDAPCSGVRMLWTCWFLASALAQLHGFGAGRYVLALAAATALAIAGNILRASSLFYVEAGLLPFGELPWLHEAVGLASFTLTALAVFFAIHWRARRAEVAA